MKIDHYEIYECLNEFVENVSGTYEVKATELKLNDIFIQVIVKPGGLVLEISTEQKYMYPYSPWVNKLNKDPTFKKAFDKLIISLEKIGKKVCVED